MNNVEVIEWIDSAHTAGWTLLDDLSSETFTCVKITTVGIVVDENHEQVILALSRSSNGQWAQPAAIPKCCVKFRKVLTSV